MSSERRQGGFTVQAALVFLFAFWLLAFHTGDASLWDIDEPNNAQSLKEMIVHHDFVVPTFNGQLRPDKPILNYWLMDVGVRLLGMNSWGLRIGSVALGALLVLYLMFALRPFLGDEAALLTGLFTATALHSQIIFRAAVPDPLLIFFVTVSLLSWLHGYLRSKGRLGHYLLAYAAMGLGTLAKGPIAFLLPGLIITVFLLLRRDLPHLWREGRLTLGVPLFLVIALPWYLAVGIATHWAWDLRFIDAQNVGRYTAAMQGHRGPIYYYLLTTFLGLLPWSVFLPQTLAEGWRQRRGMIVAQPVQAFFWLWAGLWIAFFSLGATKLPNYVWEAYPPLLALLAWRIRLALTGERPLGPWGLRASFALLATVGLVLVGLGAWLVPKDIPPLGSVAYLGLPYLLGALLALVFVQGRRLWGVIASLGAAAVGLTLCLVLLAMPSLDALKPSVTMGYLVRHLEGSRSYSLGTWRWWEPSFLFYAGRGAMTATELDAPQTQVPEILQGHPGPLFLVTPQEDVSALRRELPKGIQVRELYTGYELYSRRRISLLRIDKEKIRP
ncbi:ArnT family glycosyltransferase [Acidithiobacillus caldus]|uniref:Glycosyl transferase family 39 n=2 Tax=Acidithiobacillus caldus TaxID=33059 RepID=F9ZSK2_ACICS|nr:glycosyltransferase family 39 protein [Acidithiobacillus caldus]AEK59239.1 glycosyl transferase family 39 [Acidithiobacillus caldus SM-1]AIA56282.1 glycosyl transferase family 39 [Acidithiobacillus caldus ATCC 51756]AUW33625.1 glycosyltransferase family 39 protein [Acidithiobacillus caldus]MBU2728904.1 glycosyltransferase family 39 protein [Acidithiobacillus caldus]MBU2735315.1 glycosyltransferase family 39 protein [Acidithiobacillus caldus ATCC 51756]